MTAELHNIELMELAALIRAGDVSPVAVTRAQLDRIAALDGKLASTRW
jgi:amidase